MKVMFVIPKEYYPRPWTPHTGVAYLTAVLQQHNFSIKILDLRLGYNTKDLHKSLDAFEPDLVGVTSYSFEYESAYKVIDSIKNQGKHLVVIGGPHASAIRSRILEHTKADFAVKGEGEYTMLDLCNSINGNGPRLDEIKGLIWRNGDKIQENSDRPYIEDLDALPFPAYESFEIQKYLDYATKRIPLITSRGCPHRCIYCSVRLTMGNRFRARTAKNVVDEIDHWHRKGWKNFDINDDCFSFDLDRAKEICNLIIERGLKITYQLYNGIRVDRVDFELLQKMKASGCSFVAYGVESGNKDTLKVIKKAISLEQVKKAVKMTKEVGIRNYATFIIGHPGETFKKAMDTINFAKELPADQIGVYNIIPYPGTELYEWMLKNARMLYPLESYLNEVTYGQNKPIFETPEFTAEERRTALRIGLLLQRKKLLQLRLGKALGTLVYLAFARPDNMWARISTFRGSKFGNSIFTNLHRAIFRKTGGFDHANPKRTETE